MAAISAADGINKASKDHHHSSDFLVSTSSILLPNCLLNFENLIDFGLDLIVFIVHAILHPIAWLRRRLAKLRRPRHLPGQVISIGNLSSGGTGKSPLTISLARYLLDQGYQPAILARGYRSGLKGDEAAVVTAAGLSPLKLRHDTDPRSLHPDEAQMQAHELADVPIIIGANRYQAAQTYLVNHPTPSHWILDDGYQHVSIFRDFDFVVLDAKDPLGKQSPLALKLQREPSGNLYDADAILFSRFDKLANLGFIEECARRFRVPVVKVEFKSAEPRHRLIPFDPSGSYCLAAAIALPERLEQSLAEKGIRIKSRCFKADHRLFEPNELAAAAEGCQGIITTAKDFYRQQQCFNNAQVPTFVMGLSVDIAWADVFDQIAGKGKKASASSCPSPRLL